MRSMRFIELLAGGVKTPMGELFKDLQAGRRNHHRALKVMCT